MDVAVYKAVGLNGSVGVEPVEYKGVEKDHAHGFTRVAQKAKMRGLKVIFGNTTGINAGDTVWVKEASIVVLSKAVFDVGGTTIMLVETRDIVFVTPGS